MREIRSACRSRVMCTNMMMMCNIPESSYKDKKQIRAPACACQQEAYFYVPVFSVCPPRKKNTFNVFHRYIYFILIALQRFSTTLPAMQEKSNIPPFLMRYPKNHSHIILTHNQRINKRGLTENLKIQPQPPAVCHLHPGAIRGAEDYPNAPSRVQR